MARTHRIRRKDLRQPDEFVTLSRRTLAYTQQHRTTTVIVAATLLVLLGTFVAYRVVMVSREARAANVYGKARTVLNDKKYEEAASAFREVADSYGGTTYGFLAQLQNANSLLLAARPAEAALAYQKFLDLGPPSDDLRQVALTGLGYANEQNGKPAEAQAHFASAAALPGVLAPEALLAAARAAENAGDPQTARERYEQFLERFRTSDRRALVRDRLLALGGSTKVDDPQVDTHAVPLLADPPVGAPPETE